MRSGLTTRAINATYLLRTATHHWAHAQNEVYKLLYRVLKILIIHAKCTHSHIPLRYCLLITMPNWLVS
jgi:phosphate starvation-inducible membrane PsiE